MAAAAVTAGCASVGPDYRPPELPPRPAFAHAEKAYAVAEPQAGWWRAFNDPVLDSLVADALAENGSIKVAVARLNEARATLRGERANQGPAGGAEASYARTKPFLAQFGVDPSTSGSFDLYHAGIDASWELDLFGGGRRGVEAARARASAAEADLADVQISIAAEVAQAYLDLRALQSRLDHIYWLAGSSEKLIELTAQRRREGTASELEFGGIRYQRLADLADEPALRGAATIQMDRLAVLTGRDPGALQAQLAAVQPVPAPPAQVAIGDPGALIRRRPDVRAAERRLAAATADIGVATADLFPKVTLLGSGGSASQSLDALGGGDSGIYSVGPRLSWAFLDIPRTKARMARADSRRDAALAQYRMAVRGALQDAEAGLVRYARAQETVAARRHALASATGAAKLIDQRHAEGVATLRESIEGHRVQTQADDRLRIAEADLAKAYVVLEKSLGLAWAP